MHMEISATKFSHQIDKKIAYPSLVFHPGSFFSTFTYVKQAYSMLFSLRWKMFYNLTSEWVHFACESRSKRIYKGLARQKS